MGGREASVGREGGGFIVPSYEELRASLKFSKGKHRLARLSGSLILARVPKLSFPGGGRRLLGLLPNTFFIAHSLNLWRARVIADMFLIFLLFLKVEFSTPSVMPSV